MSPQSGSLHNPSLPQFDTDLDIPIAIQKGVRSCTTKYPISNFHSYHRINPCFQAFISQISTKSIPTNISESLKDLKWRGAVFEEMKALQQNEMWEIVSERRVMRKFAG